MRFIDLEQNSPEWHAWRDNIIGASDAASVLGIGFMTPYELYQNKLGLYKNPSNPAMDKGRLLEPLARACFIRETGIEIVPACVQSEEYPFMGASLDGITSDHSLIVEIKTGSKENLEKAKRGEIPEKYYSQMQHQLAVTGLDKCIYHFYDEVEDKGYMIDVFREPDYIQDLIKEERKFWNAVLNFEPPELSDRDFVPMSGEFVQIALELSEHLENLRKEEEIINTLRSRLIELSDNKSCVGGGIKLTKIPRLGAIDYKKIEALKGVDLEAYRKPSIVTWRVSKEKSPELD